MAARKRPYRSQARRAKAAETKERILAATRKAFAERGFERTTIDAVATAARVSAALVYALFESKEGLLRAVIDATVFGRDYRALVESITAQDDPSEIVRTAARITRSIYEAEVRQLGSIHRAGIVSSALRKLEEDLEAQRYERQAVVVRLLADAGALKRGLAVATARDILWSLTSGELYRLLVLERHWPPDAYEEWLAALLSTALLEPGQVSASRSVSRRTSRRG